MADIVHGQMTTLANTNGGCEKDDPDLAVPGQLLGPGRGIVKNVPSDDLIKNDSD
jgi:hypothetical protein